MRVFEWKTLMRNEGKGVGYCAEVGISPFSFYGVEALSTDRHL